MGSHFSALFSLGLPVSTFDGFQVKYYKVRLFKIFSIFICERGHTHAALCTQRTWSSTFTASGFELRLSRLLASYFSHPAILLALLSPQSPNFPNLFFQTPYFKCWLIFISWSSMLIHLWKQWLKQKNAVMRNWLTQRLVGRLFSLKLFFFCTSQHFPHSTLSQVMTPSVSSPRGISPFSVYSLEYHFLKILNLFCSEVPRSFDILPSGLYTACTQWPHLGVSRIAHYQSILWRTK